MRSIKNRRSVGVLLMSTLVIWGIILYRIIAYSHGEKTEVPLVENNRNTVRKLKDSLLLNYRDPFLGISPEKPPKVVHSFRTKRVPEAPEQPPTFRFAGKIRKGKQEFLLIISGHDTRLISTRAREIEGFRVERIDRDSLRVCKGKRKYTLRLE